MATDALCGHIVSYVDVTNYKEGRRAWGFPDGWNGLILKVIGITHIAPMAKTTMTAAFSLRPICSGNTRSTGRIEKTRSPAHVIAE